MLAIGDAVSDRAPLQVGQFESGLEMDMWLTRIWLEGRGGDLPESYTLAHWFGAHHTATDAWGSHSARHVESGGWRAVCRTSSCERSRTFRPSE